MSVPEPKLAAVGTPAPDAPGAPVNAVVSQPPSPGGRLEAWLALVCRMIPDVDTAFAGLDDPGNEGFGEMVTWPANAPAHASLEAAARRALQRDEGIACEVSDDGDEIIARRLKLGPGRGGAIAVAVPALGDNARNALLQLLDWSAVWLEFVSAGNDTGAATAERLLLAGLDAADLRRAATRMAAIIATTYAAERVSIGLRDGDELELIALSHSAAFNPRLQLNRDIIAVMEEALDESQPLLYPPDPSASPTVHHAHERLSHGDTPASVCTLPLLVEGRAIGAMTLERGADKPFDAHDLARLSGPAAAIGRVLDTRIALARPLHRQLGDALARKAAAFGAPGGALGKTLLLAGVAALAIVFFGTGQMQIGAPAVLEGRIQRSLTAPIDGYVAEAPARAGDALKAGDIIAVIDTQSLEFERRRWAAEQAEYTKTHRRAIAELDRAEAAIAKARLGRASSQLALIEEQLQRATVTAPFDGMIISGDLSRSMGAPVSRGDVLFEIAPLDDYRVELEVDERDIADVAVGQSGSLALTALPGERLAFTVDQITNVAETSDGRNVFRVEAQLDENAPLLRPGMRGVAKVNTGEDRLIRTWTRGAFDRIRLWLWARMP